MQPAHLKDFIKLAVNTGCRKEKLLSLEWARVDLHRCIFYLEGRQIKSGKRRSIPINTAAQGALLSRLEFRKDYCPNSPWVFAHESGERLRSIKNSFSSACESAGIKDFRIHDLRHTCAAWLVSSGAQLAEVKELLGHSTITMTERYAHLSPERVRSAVNLLDISQSRFGHGSQDQEYKKRTPQTEKVLFLSIWCERRELNPHARRHWILNPARLPIPPLSPT